MSSTVDCDVKKVFKSSAFCMSSVKEVPLSSTRTFISVVLLLKPDNCFTNFHQSLFENLFWVILVQRDSWYCFLAHRNRLTTLFLNNLNLDQWKSELLFLAFLLNLSLFLIIFFISLVIHGRSPCLIFMTLFGMQVDAVSINLEVKFWAIISIGLAGVIIEFQSISDSLYLYLG